ncbi:hypothetical protein [Polaribacter staleyi]|uniref:hypothetical protein n=1 Tax=Polaribacter staleyi TaxID=2022337 RepID=UPI0031BAFEC2
MKLKNNTTSIIKKILNYSIFFILIIGILGAGGLVLEEFKTGEGCPKILSIPMCLVILICFIIPLIAHTLKRWNWSYFLCTGFAGAIALLASSMQFIGKAACPKTASGTPMCYHSLLIFSSLILLKIVVINYSKKIRS